MKTDIFLNRYPTVDLHGLDRDSARMYVNDFVLEFVESIYSSYKKDMIITDNESVIAGSGAYKKDLIGKKNIS